MDQPHGCDLRIGRVSEAERIYLLTAVTAYRQPFFLDFAAARSVIRALQHADNTGRTATLAFVLMPDHLHWLVTLRVGALAEVMKSVKGFTARQINRQKGTTGAVWQHGYHDHALRCDEDVRQTARYIVANPVRAGLVESVWGYPHWDAVWIEDAGATSASR